MERKRNKKPHYYFTSIPISFPLGALPLGYHFPVPPNMKKFCDKNFCRNSTNKERLHLEETQIESDINEEMNEDSCELEEKNFSACEESKWQKSKENDIYELGRALFPMELLCQTSHQESNSRETKGISLTKPGSSEETVHEDRTKKSIPSIYDKPYIQQNKEIQAQSFSLPITSETARNNEIKCKRNKAEIAKMRSENMMIFQGVNRALIEQELSLCKHLWGNYAGSVSWEAMKGQNGHHADLACEVSNLTECMKVKAGYGEDLYDVRNFGFNHIILVGRIWNNVLDCYGRVFELDRMSDALWPLGNSLEEVATKPWTGEVAWDVDEDGVVFEWEYYTEAERTTHDFKRADDKKPGNLRESIKKSRTRTKIRYNTIKQFTVVLEKQMLPLHGTHSRSFSSFGFAIKIFQFFSATTKEVLRQKLISGYVEGGYVEGERIEGYVKDACVEGCVEGRCVIIEGCIEDGVFSTVLFSRSILLGLRRFAAGFGELLLKGSNFFDNSFGRKGSISTLQS
ncbi:hypothetical protein GLOIN_2v1563037 [Rhizophagus irregularis DAOM 181602=DAOM 197198]|nr:hypothetical protein GLOIN_2v1563037 [Rhizophagus irregularis DAOM 181602=DAOM 197198]